jgi:ribosomal protein S18 acetylase RimI-like enzyme
MVEYRILTALDEKQAVIEACDHAFSNPVSQRDCYESLLMKIHAHAEFLAAYRQGPAGYLAMYANDTVGKTAYITLLAVKPECQKMRIGATLMQMGLTLARERGMKAVKLEVNMDNTGAIGLYERLGFVRLHQSGANGMYMVKHLDEK